MGKGAGATARHKSDNTFKFQSFSTKLKLINRNFALNLHDGRYFDEDGAEVSYLYEAIIHRTELDLTGSFTSLVAEIGPNVKSLPQVVHKKDRILKIIYKNIVQKEALECFSSTLELTKALARDLDSEFCSHMPSFTSAICQVILQNKNVEIIELGFQCVAQLFVHFRAHLMKTFSTYLKILLPMWNSSNKTYVAVFTAECIQIVATKVWRNSSEQFFDSVFSMVLKYPDAKHGVASLLTSMIRKTTSNEMDKLLDDCLKWFKEPQVDFVLWREILTLLVSELNNLKYNEADEDLKVYCDCVQKRLFVCDKSQHGNVFNEYLRIYGSILASSGFLKEIGKRCSSLLSLFKESIGKVQGSQEIFVNILCSIITRSPSKEVVNLTLGFIQQTSGIALNNIYQALIENQWELNTYLIPIVTRFEAQEPSDMLELGPSANKFTMFASEAISYRMRESVCERGSQMFSIYSEPSYYWKKIHRNVVSDFHLKHPKTSLFDTCSLLDFVLKTSEEDLTAFLQLKESIIRFFVTFESVHFTGQRCKHCLNACLKLSNKIIQYLTHGVNTTSKDLHAILYHVLEVQEIYWTKENSLMTNEYLRTVVECIQYDLPFFQRGGQFSLWALKGLDNFLAKAKNALPCNLNATIIQDSKIVQYLILNLHCGLKIVRALSMSILHRMEVFLCGDKETIQLLEICLSIEQLNIHEVAFLTNANQHLEKLKVMASKKSAVKIIANFLLGYMVTNFQPIWAKCIAIIKICLATDCTAATNECYDACFTFANHNNHPKSHLLLEIPTDLVNVDEEGFCERISFSKFALDSKNCYEHMDLNRYRVNIWTCAKGINENATELAYSFGRSDGDGSYLTKSAKEILGYVMQKFPFRGLNLSSELLGLRMVLVPVLNFLAKSPVILEDKFRDQWFDILKDMLASPVEVSSLVLKILCRLKHVELNPYAEKLNSLLRDNQLDGLREFNMDKSTQGFKVNQDHKKIVLEVLSRIVLEKCISKEKGRQDSVLKSVAMSGHTITLAFTELALKFWEDRSAFRDCPSKLKLVERRINLINGIIKNWHYQYTDVPEKLVGILCKMVDFVNLLDDDEIQMPKKGTLALARLCLENYFSYFPKLELPAERRQSIMNEFIWPGLENLRKSGVNDVNWILRIFKTWSKVTRYRTFFTEVNQDGLKLAHILCQLLSSGTTSRDVKLHLLTVVFSLISEENTFEMPGGSKDQDFRPVPVEDPFEIGRAVISDGQKEIAAALTDKWVFKQLCISRDDSNVYLNVLPRLTEFLKDPTVLSMLIKLIIGSLDGCRSDEQALFNSFQTLEMALVTLNEEEQQPLLMEIAPLFSWIKGDQLRKGLYLVLGAWKSNNMKLVAELNSHDIKNLNTSAATVALRRQALNTLEGKLIVFDSLKDLLLWNFVVNTCFYNLETDSHAEVIMSIQMIRKLAKSICQAVKSAVLRNDSSSKVEQNLLNDFIGRYILPPLRVGIKNRIKGPFMNYLELTHVLVEELNQCHGSFAEMKFLMDEEILLKLKDLQINERTHGMNKLSTTLKKMKTGEITRVSSAILLTFIKPIAYHNLLVESRDAKAGININELVDASIEVVKDILQLISYQNYIKFLSNTLEKETANPTVMKQLERLLIGAMESFHFDLSAATFDDTSETSTDANVEQMDTNDMTKTSNLVILDRNAAKKCLDGLLVSVIPKLTNCLNGTTTLAHKLSHEKKNMVQEGVVQRVTFAKALSTLIKKLPRGSVSDTFNTLIPKVCASIKSKQESVRNAGRANLVHLLEDMGMKYFPTTFHYLQASLQRGYERHVLNYTLNHIMTKCEVNIAKYPTYLPIKGLVQLCSLELFSPMREEKKVPQMIMKTFEVKKDNARPMLEKCAKFVQDTETLNVMVDIPLEGVSQTSDNAKEVRLWFSKVSSGLAKNEYIEHEQILTWLGVKLETYCGETNSDPNGATGSDGRPMLTGRRSTLEINRLGNRRVHDNKSHKSVVLMEFVFECLNDRLKKVSISNELSKSFIPYLVDGLSGKSKKVNLFALRCLTNLFGYGAFDFHRDEETLNSIWQRTFSAISTNSLSSTNDHEFVNALFKCLATFLAVFVDFKIMENDFDVLIVSVRSFLVHGHCSSSAMNLLKCVMGQKLISKDFKELMEYVRDLSITSGYEHILEGCRKLYADFLLNYCTKVEECNDNLAFYFRHLSYQVDSGRLSALEMLLLLLKQLPETIVRGLTPSYFVGLIVALDHETNPLILAKISTCMKSLLKDYHSVDTVSSNLLNMMRDEEITSKQVFAQVAGWVVCKGWHHITGLKLQSIMKFYEEVLKDIEDFDDNVIFQCLSSINQILEFKATVENERIWNSEGRFEKLTENILQYVRESCLSHPHMWVQVTAMQICNNVLKNVDSSKLFVNLCRDGVDICRISYCFLVTSFTELIHLIESHVGVFRSPISESGEIVKAVTDSLTTFMHLTVAVYNDEKGTTVLAAFMKQLVNLINHEVRKDPGETKQRLLAYQLLEVFVSNSSAEALKEFKNRMIQSSLRDSSDPNTPAGVRAVADALMENLKKKIGDQSFMDSYIGVHQRLQERRNKKRAEKAENIVLHPGIKRRKKN